MAKPTPSPVRILPWEESQTLHRLWSSGAEPRHFTVFVRWSGMESAWAQLRPGQAAPLTGFQAPDGRICVFWPAFNLPNQSAVPPPSELDDGRWSAEYSRWLREHTTELERGGSPASLATQEITEVARQYGATVTPSSHATRWLDVTFREFLRGHPEGRILLRNLDATRYLGAEGYITCLKHMATKEGFIPPPTPTGGFYDHVGLLVVPGNLEGTSAEQVQATRAIASAEAPRPYAPLTEQAGIALRPFAAEVGPRVHETTQGYVEAFRRETGLSGPPPEHGFIIDGQFHLPPAVAQVADAASGSAATGLAAGGDGSVGSVDPLERVGRDTIPDFETADTLPHIRSSSSVPFGQVVADGVSPVRPVGAGVGDVGMGSPSVPFGQVVADGVSPVRPVGAGVGDVGMGSSSVPFGQVVADGVSPVRPVGAGVGDVGMGSPSVPFGQVVAGGVSPVRPIGAGGGVVGVGSSTLPFGQVVADGVSPVRPVGAGVGDVGMGSPTVPEGVSTARPGVLATESAPGGRSQHFQSGSAPAHGSGFGGLVEVAGMILGAWCEYNRAIDRGITDPVNRLADSVAGAALATVGGPVDMTINMSHALLPLVDHWSGIDRQDPTRFPVAPSNALGWHRVGEDIARQTGTMLFGASYMVPRAILVPAFEKLVAATPSQVATGFATYGIDATFAYYSRLSGQADALNTLHVNVAAGRYGEAVRATFAAIGVVQQTAVGTPFEIVVRGLGVGGALGTAADFLVELDDPSDGVEYAAVPPPPVTPDLLAADRYVKQSDDRHVKPGDDRHVKPGDDRHVKPGDDRHVKPGDDRHVKPGDDRHVKPGDDRHVKQADDGHGEPESSAAHKLSASPGVPPPLHGPVVSPTERGHGDPDVTPTPGKQPSLGSDATKGDVFPTQHLAHTGTQHGSPAGHHLPPLSGVAPAASDDGTALARQLPLHPASVVDRHGVEQTATAATADHHETVAQKPSREHEADSHLDDKEAKHDKHHKDDDGSEYGGDDR